ncbi:hypothetical protein NTH_04201 (plasmid) [Nitratireductor thuwali]|uniref:Uncharacterized protein n=1 Tax=Nitratireductor thuwali TaxID=2267699 RepID=A0ABY5MQX5_9HYPH|nr:hypothetical protein NTH_04201 [Nitratireductor thuwali]
MEVAPDGPAFRLRRDPLPVHIALPVPGSREGEPDRFVGTGVFAGERPPKGQLAIRHFQQERVDAAFRTNAAGIRMEHARAANSGRREQTQLEEPVLLQGQDATAAAGGRAKGGRCAGLARALVPDLDQLRSALVVNK